MKRTLFLAAALLTLFAVSCASGDKKPAAKPTERPAATAEPTKSATSDKTSTAQEPTKGASNEGSSDALSSLFGSVFQGGLSGSGGAGSGLSTGDESLKAFLPSEGDFPDGYTNIGAFTFSAPGDSELGKTDMAMTMSMKGDPSTFAGSDPGNIDFSQIEMLIAMVMKPEDLQALEEVFDEIKNLDPQEIEDEVNSSLGEMEGFEVKRFEVLDASDLGEGGFGLEMTIDMSGFGSLFGAFGGEGADLGLEAMTMRMYIFGRGDHVGAVMRMGFTDSLDGGSEDIKIAEVIDGKLAGA